MNEVYRIMSSANWIKLIPNVNPNTSNTIRIAKSDARYDIAGDLISIQDQENSSNNRTLLYTNDVNTSKILQNDGTIFATIGDLETFLDENTGFRSGGNGGTPQPPDTITGAQIAALLFAEADTNNFNDAAMNKLAGLVSTVVRYDIQQNLSLIQQNNVKNALGITDPPIQPPDLNVNAFELEELPWDASTGLFPSGSQHGIGAVFLISEAGTVDGVDFTTNDLIVQLTETPNANTYANNWIKIDNDSLGVQMWGGLSGIVSDSDITSVLTRLGYSTGSGGGTGNHPVTLTRDTPSLTALANLAAASLNTNSGLWVVANNQVLSTEQNVDSTVMIRALSSGLMDANGNMIPTTPTSKSGIALAIGTIVRVFSSTDLRVVATPTRSASSRYPDIPAVSSPLNLTVNEATYNTYRNRTFVLGDDATTSTSTFQVYLPSLQDSDQLAYLNRNDVFGFRNDRTDGLVMRVRTFQVGTTFSNGFSEIDVRPNQALYVSPAPTGIVWQVLEFGQATDVTPEAININTDWYRDGEDATAANNSVRLHHQQSLANGLVRDHIVESSANNNPISLKFQHRNLQDDIAWIQFWSTWNSNVPPLGANIDEIKSNIPTALTYIEDNIASGFDFDFDSPDSILSIQSIGHVSGNTVRITLHSAFIPASFAVNHEIRISGATNNVHNGIFLIDSVSSSGNNIVIHVTNSQVSDSSFDETSGGSVAVPLYARVVFISNDLRQVNFRLYLNSTRTSERTHFNPDWFDKDADNISSVLSIGYNTDIETLPSSLAVQDDAGDWFIVKGGGRGSVTKFDNRTSYNSSPNALPVNFENINIDTLGVSSFYIPEYPSHLEAGETRKYKVYSYPQNDRNDVTLFVGAPGAGNFVTFDEGIVGIDILPNTFHEIELYNDGTKSGVRLLTPVSRNVPSTRVYQSPTLVSALPANNLLKTSIIDVISIQNEDINGRFINVGSQNSNKLTLQANADYVFEATIDVLFNGAEGTGLLFLPVTLMPRITRDGTADDKEEFAHTVSLIFSRNGQSGSSAPKFAHTLKVRFEWQGEVGDIVEFQLRTGTFPNGYNTGHIQVQNWKWSAQANLNLN